MGRCLENAPWIVKKTNGNHYPIVNGLWTDPLCLSNCNFAHPFSVCKHINVTEWVLEAERIDLNVHMQREKDIFQPFKKIMDDSTKMATSNSNYLIDEMKNKPKNANVMKI